MPPKNFCFDPASSLQALEAYVAYASKITSLKECLALAYFRAGELNEQRNEYSLALRNYKQVLEIDPGHGRAMAAQMRIQFLEANQNNLILLQRFERMRVSAVLNVDEWNALARQALFLPSEHVRDDLLLSMITVLLDSRQQPKASVDISLPLARGEHASTNPYVRAHAYELAYCAMQTLNDWAQIRQELLSDSKIPSTLRIQIQRDQRRRLLHQVASIALMFFACSLGSLFIACTYRRQWLRCLFYFRKPIVWIFMGVATLAGFAIAEIWETNAGILFLRFGMCLVVMHLWVSVWRACVEHQRAWVRLIGSCISVVSLWAAAYWVLEHTSVNGVPMLDEFGL